MDQPEQQPEQQSKQQRETGFASKLAALRNAGRLSRMGKKGLAKQGLRSLGPEGAALAGAVDTAPGNLVFAVCFIAAIFKDALDFVGESMIGLVGAAGGIIVSPIAAMLAWIPFIGQMTAAVLELIPAAIGFSAWFAVLMLKVGLSAVIWLLLFRQMLGFKAGMRLMMMAFQWLISVVSIFENFSFLLNLAPLMSITVGFGWAATMLLKESGGREESSGKQESQTSPSAQPLNATT